MFVFLFSLLFFFTNVIFSQEINYQSKKNAPIDKIQSDLLKKTLNNLSNREVDSYLKEMGVSFDGSIYQKRKILEKIILPKEKDETNRLEQILRENNQKNLPIQIESATEGEFLSVDENTNGVLVLRGKVVLKLSKGRLKANIITIDSKKKSIYAEGDITYTEENLTVKGYNFIYDLNLERGVIYKIRGDYYPAYFFGEKLKKLDNESYQLEIAYFTTCNAEKPHYSFKAKKITIQEDKSIAISNARLYVGSFAVLPIPFLYLSSLGNGWNVQFGSNNTQGNFIQNTYNWSVPGFSFLLPINYQIRLDWYEKTGEVLQIQMRKISPWLNYSINLGYANHKKYTFSNSFEQRLGTSFGFGNTVITNQVYTDPLEEVPSEFKTGLPYYRDVGIKRENWYKANVLLNARKSSNEKNYTRNFFIQFDDYSNVSFEYEYGYRYNSRNSFDSFYTEDESRLPLLLNNLKWSAVYVEKRENLNINLKIDKNLSYYNLRPESKSDFFPTSETLPQLNISNDILITKLPFYNSPIYYNIDFLVENKKYYSTVPKQNKVSVSTTETKTNTASKYSVKPLRNDIFTSIENGLRTSMIFNNYMSFTPHIYYGLQESFVSYEKNELSNSDVSYRETLKQKNYQYFRSNNNLRLGFPELFFNVKQNQKVSYKPEAKNTVDGNQIQNELELSLESYLIDNWNMSLLSTKDIRRHRKEIDDKEKWNYTIFRLSGFFDFINTKKRKLSLMEIKRSFYSGIYINNDFVYDTAQSKSHSNIVDLSYKMGGFSFPLIQKFKEFDIGFNWYHVYANASLDRYSFFFKTDVELSQNVGFDISLDSAVSESWQFTKYVEESKNQKILAMMLDSNTTVTSSEYDQLNTVYGLDAKRKNFFKDILAGFGFFGPVEKNNTAFNIQKLLFNLKYNLHQWDFKIGYGMEVRSIASGFNLERRLDFYDQSIYFSASMAKFSFGKTEKNTDKDDRGYKIFNQTKDYFDSFVWQDWIN